MCAAQRTRRLPLEAELISELPDPIEVGAGTVLYLEGRCDPAAEPGSLRVGLGGLRAPVDGERMPEPDSREPGSRWWSLFDIPADAALGEQPLILRFRVDGREAVSELGSANVVVADRRLSPPAPSVPESADGPLIAVCMATHEPDPARLERQIESIRAQDWPDWVCVISDDASSSEGWAAVQAIAEGEDRVMASRSGSRLGFYRNFERALRLAPVEAEFIALSDQDDHWDSDKLSALHGALVASPANRLAYSDMRIVDGNGELISDTYWILRRNNHTDLAGLLVANTVTGAAALMRSSLLADALPFPPAIGEPYHDHWLALCALASGELAYLDRPTYDRTRHVDSVTAETHHAETLAAMASGERVPARGARRSLRERVRSSSGGRATFQHRYLLLAQLARVLELRLDDRIPEPKRRALRRFQRARSSASAALWLALRSLRPIIGHDETMGRERVLLGGVVWWRLAKLRARRPQRS